MAEGHASSVRKAKNTDDFEEYIVFTVTASDGREVELAVVDEFEVDGNNYVAAALVVGDTISEDGVFIYRIKETEPELQVEKITDPEEYAAVSEAYAEME